MNLTQKTIRAGSWQFVSVAAKVIIQLFVIAILARHISPQEFGLIALANVALVFVEMFAEAGIGPAIIQRKNLTKDYIQAGFTLAVLSGIFFVAVLWLLAPLIANFFKSEQLTDVIRWLGLPILVIKFGTISRSLLERDMRFDKLAWVDIGSYSFGYAIVSITMAILGYGVWAIVAGKITQCCLQSMFSFLLCPHPIKPVFVVEKYKSIGIYGGGLTIARFFDTLASQGDIFIVGRFCGTSLLGIYERAASIMTMPGQYLGYVIDKAMFPAMSTIQDNSIRLQNAYLRAIGLVNIILVPFSVLMFLVAPELIGLLLGPNWTEAVIPFRILIITLSLRIVGNLSDTLVRATGAVYASARRKPVFAFFVIFGSWVGQHWGIAGVAIAVNIAIVINYAIFTQLSMKLINMKFTTYFNDFKKGYLLGGILLIISFILISALRFYTNSAFIILSVGCIGSILLLLVIMFCFLPILLDNTIFWFLFQLMGENCWKLPVVGNRIKSSQTYSVSSFDEIP